MVPSARACRSATARRGCISDLYLICINDAESIDEHVDQYSNIVTQGLNVEIGKTLILYVTQGLLYLMNSSSKPNLFCGSSAYGVDNSRNPILACY